MTTLIKIGTNRFGPNYEEITNELEVFIEDELPTHQLLEEIVAGLKNNETFKDTAFDVINITLIDYSK